MVQDAEPGCLEERCGVSNDTLQPDEWHSRPADCARSPRSTSDFGFNPIKDATPHKIQKARGQRPRASCLKNLSPSDYGLNGIFGGNTGTPGMNAVFAGNSSPTAGGSASLPSPFAGISSLPEVSVPAVGPSDTGSGASS